MALLLPLALAGCTAGPDVDHRAELRGIPAPADDWSPHRAEVADVLVPDNGRLRKVDGVWGSGDRGFGVSWRAPVAAGDEEARCAEAAQWLVETARSLPGEPFPETGADPAVDTVRARCVRAFDTPAQDGAVSDVFATTTNTRYGALQYGGWLTYRSSGLGRSLVAGVVAKNNG